MTPLILNGLNGSTAVPDSYLLVALDETGHERLSALHHPVFGIGGCAIPVHAYAAAIRDPWSALKTQYFSGRSGPLHASAMQFTTPQLEALDVFFRAGAFARIAVVCSVATSLPANVVPYQIVARAILERIARLVGRSGCDGVVIILEASRRLDRLAAQFFEGYHVELQESAGRRRLEMLKYRMGKQAAEPCLEVADFVVQAAGGQVRSHLKGHAWGGRRDFQAVFRSVPEHLSEFADILDVAFTPPVA